VGSPVFSPPLGDVPTVPERFARSVVTEGHEKPAGSAPAKKRGYWQIELFGRAPAAPGEIGTPTAAT
jgi:hypothetical protein